MEYQHRLRADFRQRKLHPTIEALIWAYHLGKPAQPMAMSDSLALDVHARVEEERRLFATLDLQDLEQLAAESQGLVDRAIALAKRRESDRPGHRLAAPEGERMTDTAAIAPEASRRPPC